MGSTPIFSDEHNSIRKAPAGEERSHVVELPPLENGDRLTREEFERRYAAMPDVKKAELIDWFVLRDGVYQRLTSDASGGMTSRTFPGLRLAVPALPAGDMAQVVGGLQKGLDTAAHAEFVTRLEAQT